MNVNGNLKRGNSTARYISQAARYAGLNGFGFVNYSSALATVGQLKKIL